MARELQHEVPDVLAISRSSQVRRLVSLCMYARSSISHLCSRSAGLWPSSCDSRT